MQRSWSPDTLLVGLQNITVFLEKVLTVPLVPEIPLLEIYPKEMKAYVCTKILNIKSSLIHNAGKKTPNVYYLVNRKIE